MTTLELRALLDNVKAVVAKRGMADDPEIASMVEQLERKYDDLLVSEARIALAEANIIVLKAMQQ